MQRLCNQAASNGDEAIIIGVKVERQLDRVGNKLKQPVKGDYLTTKNMYIDMSFLCLYYCHTSSPHLQRLVAFGISIRLKIEYRSP